MCYDLGVLFQFLPCITSYGNKLRDSYQLVKNICKLVVVHGIKIDVTDNCIKCIFKLKQYKNVNFKYQLYVDLFRENWKDTSKYTCFEIKTTNNIGKI